MTENTALMKRHGIPIGNVVQHHRWSGKDCPQMLRKGMPYSWAEFINRVTAYMSEAAPTPPEPSQAPQETAHKDTVTVVVKGRITVDGIRINGRVYAAVRPVCEALGHAVKWDGTQVTIQ